VLKGIQDSSAARNKLADITYIAIEAASSEDVEGSKPEPDIFEAVLKKLNILALQLPSVRFSESMGNHDSNIVDAGSVD
jgi:beta-phosphoglucomutase-like phosphatase (HAD superfamily)